MIDKTSHYIVTEQSPTHECSVLISNRLDDTSVQIPHTRDRARIISAPVVLFLCELRCARSALARLRSDNLPVRLSRLITALFNNIRTLKFKAQPTNAFFTTVSQIAEATSKEMLQCLPQEKHQVPAQILELLCVEWAYTDVTHRPLFNDRQN